MCAYVTKATNKLQCWELSLNKNIHCLMKIALMFVILSCFLETSFSDDKAPEAYETAQQYLDFEYHYSASALYNSLYSVKDYYVSTRGIFRLLTILAMGYRNYYEYYQHRPVGDKIDSILLIFSLVLMPVNFIYDVFENTMRIDDGDVIKFKSQAIAPPSFELELSSSLEYSALYNISDPLREFGVRGVTFISSRIDNEEHLLGKLELLENDDQIFFDIKFSSLDYGSYYWIELCCNKKSDCNISNGIPLSVLSEDVFHILKTLLARKNFFEVSSVDFKITKGIDFSVNERFIVVKFKKREYNSTATYSICDTNDHTLQLKTNHFNYSNQTLISEINKKLFSDSGGWFLYLLKLAAKQFEHGVFFWINDSIFEQLFLGECGICHEAMVSGAISIASCCRHFFCTSCLKQWKQSGSGRCPFCR